MNCVLEVDVNVLDEVLGPNLHLLPGCGFLGNLDVNLFFQEAPKKLQ